LAEEQIFLAETKTAAERAATVAAAVVVDRAVPVVDVAGKWATDAVAVGVVPRRSGPGQRYWREPADLTTAPALCQPSSSSPEIKKHKNKICKKYSEVLNFLNFYPCIKK
jgi:hypothetical protein